VGTRAPGLRHHANRSGRVLQSCAVQGGTSHSNPASRTTQEIACAGGRAWASR
jgi:hypothetical protein